MGEPDLGKDSTYGTRSNKQVFCFPTKGTTTMKRLTTQFVQAVAMLGLVAGVAGQATAANLITNGGFETGDFTGWTITDQRSGTLVGSSPFTGGSPTMTYLSHTGTYFALLGNNGVPATVSQTVDDASGQNYTLSFWLANDGDTPNSLTVLFGGSTLLSGTDLPASPYTQYTYTVVGTGSDTLSFVEQNNPGYFSLDDVSLVGPSTVPEPSSLALFAVGAAGFVGYAWRRRRRQAQA